jgi:hypothetical protein
MDVYALTVAPMENASCEQIDEVVLQRNGQQRGSFLGIRDSRTSLFLTYAWKTVIVYCEILQNQHV